jgi:translation initiation factor 3 subunit C
LTRLVQRQNTLSGSTVEPIPPVYFRVLVTLETALSDEKEKDSKKKMEAAKARALNTMRQKLRKALKEYENDYKAYTEDVGAYAARFAALTQPETAPKDKKVKKQELPDTNEGDGFATVGKGGKTYGLGAGDIYKTLAAIQEARGKKVGLLIFIIYPLLPTHHP